MKNYFDILKLFLLLTFLANPFFANAVTPQFQKKVLLISGRVNDYETGEPLPNVTVRVQGSNVNTTTNVEGYFTLHNIPSDTSVIVFNILGYHALRLQLSPKQSFKNIKIEMTSTTGALNEVVVTGKKEGNFKLNQKTGMISLTPAAIAGLPNLGEKDLFRSLQLMPGVSAGNEQSAGLYVRGGTPDQNLVLFDGFTVYNVDHMFGFFSAFNSNAVKDLQLYKSAFESKYGGRLSSVVDINGKEGNKKQFNAGADLSLLSINLFIESPLGKKASGLITYRRSFKTGLYNKIVNKINGNSSSQTSGPSGPGGGPSGGPSGGPNGRLGGTSDVKSYFDDLNAKFSYRPTEKDVLAWSFYTGKDELDNSLSSSGGGMTQGGGQLGSFNSSNSDITKWGNTGSSLKWSRKWNAQLFSNTLISYSNYFSNRLNTRQLLRDSITTITAGIIENNDLKDVSLKSDIEWTPFKNHAIWFGYQFTQNDIKYTYARSDTANLVDMGSKGKTLALYLQDKISLVNNKLILTPGLRTTNYNITGKVYYEPRFDITYHLNDNIKLKGAAGKYYQFAKRVLREDIMQGSRDFWLLADDKRLPVSSALQYVAGMSWENGDYL
ncbi:MAG: carboxypeptidase-like regulatory domain-containing protein, partial [Bacteroidota bacterium]